MSGGRSMLASIVGEVGLGGEDVDDFLEQDRGGVGDDGGEGRDLPPGEFLFLADERFRALSPRTVVSPAVTLDDTEPLFVESEHGVALGEHGPYLFDFF